MATRSAQASPARPCQAEARGYINGEGDDFSRVDRRNSKTMTNDCARPAASPTRPPRVFRVPLGQRVFSLIAVVFVIAATCIMMLAAAVVFIRDWPLGLFIAAIAAFMAGLSGYSLRDLRGKLGLKVVLDTDSATFDLPAGRSLIHRPPAQHLALSYGDIDSIETRYEGYRSLGMALMQQAYVLRRKNGALVFLFEERALATRFASSLYSDIITELTARAHVPLHDLGVVEGKGGALCVWGAQSPDWAAPALPRDQALRLWRHAAATGSLAMAGFIAIVVALGFGRKW
jgi:hypothetical protein